MKFLPTCIKLLLTYIFFSKTFFICAKERTATVDSKPKVSKQAEKKIQDLLQKMNDTYSIGNIEALEKVNTLGREGLMYLQKSPSLKPSFKFLIYTYMSASYSQLMVNDSSSFYFEQANDLLNKEPSIETGFPNFYTSYWGNQGVHYRELAQYSKAINCLEKARIACIKYHLDDYELIILNHLANVYDYMTEYDKAYKIYKEIQRRGFGTSNKLQILASIGWNAFKRDKPELAESYFKQALEIYKNKPNNQTDIQFETKLYLQIAQLKSYSTNYKESNYFLRKAIGIYTSRHITKGVYLAKCYAAMANNSSKSKDIVEALNWTQKGLSAIVLDFSSDNISQNPALSQIILGNNTLFQLLALKAQLLYKYYQQTKQISTLRLSTKTYHLAILIAENYRQGIDYEEDKSIFTSISTSIFDEAIDVAYHFYQTNPTDDKANLLFSIIESTRAIALNDYVNKIQPSKETSSLVQQQKTINHFIAELKQSLWQDNSKSKLDSIKTLLLEKELQLTSLNNKIAKLSPVGSVLSFDNQSLATDIKQKLPQNTAFISYSLRSPNLLYIFLIKSDLIQVKKLSLQDSSLANTLRSFLPKLNINPQWNEYNGQKEAIQLYDWLLKPIERNLHNTQRLVLAREGILNYLPFETLETGKIISDYLIRHYAISYTYSGQNFISSTPREALSSNRILTATPFTQTHIIEQDTFKALRSRIIKPAEGQLWLNDRAATKAQLMTKLPYYNVLNLVTHSVSDTLQSKKSYLFLYPLADKTASKLGFYEALGLPLTRYKLVMLASCKSGTGHLENHEGVMSLSYAFVRAGAHAVVAAQWQAHDRSSDFISNIFFEYINEGIPKDLALQKAKIDFIQSEQFGDLNHPFFWANLILSGSAEAIYPPKHQSFWGIGIILFILILAYLLARTKKFKILWPKIFATKS
jgi:CHAT domain-containing protein/tetratricopeptide (TPR) repeat protein